MHTNRGMNTKCYAMLLCGLLGMACNGGPTVWAQGSLTGEAEEAVAMWQQACPSLGLSVTHDRNAADIIVVWHNNPHDMGGSNKDGIVWIDPTRMADRAHRVVPLIAHELGHILGASHSDNEGDLMFPKVWASMPSEADKQQVCP